MNKSTLAGLLAGIGAFGLWGLLPAYWKALGEVPAPEIFCHRVLWCLVFVGIVLTWQRRLRDLAMSRRSLGLLSISGGLLCINWLTYIWGVNAGYVLDASMGYYINPLVNVLLGCIFFQDRLRPLQILAILLAATGVGYMVYSFGRVPWIALTLALTFGFYGLIRKKIAVESLPGLSIEMSVLCLPALAYLAMRHGHGLGALGGIDVRVDLLLIGAGAVTAVPLLLFAFCARRLRLVEVGILQYLAPTGMFLLGVFAYNEPFNVSRLLSFIFIWTGIAVYVLESVWFFKRSMPEGNLP
ncbi:MAG: EamA family transporter RarD [Desulfovermiculus sp.]|nr:EamA family transporter RarD [Desulfovermiculus sp.]